MSSQSDHSHPHHKGRAMVTKDYFQQSTSYYSDNSSTNNNASSDYSVGPAAWTQVGRFVPQNSFDPDINILSLSSTQRARLLEQREGTSRAFVETGVYTGGLPSGGPSANPRGYVRVEGERGMAVVHKRGERFIDGRPVDLGPAFGTGSEHDAECRRHTRNSAYQYTCFCRPRRDSELQEHVPGRSGNRGSFVTPRLYSSETQFVSADKRVSLRQAVDASYSNPGLPKHVSGNTENGGNLATLSSASKTQFISPEGYAMDDLSVTEETWETIRDKIPDDDLRWGIYFENGCWTFFHDPRNITTIIPLRIAGAPVVVPIYSPPFIHPGTVSPSDPCPKLINPYHEIPDNVVVNLLESFPFALAFYILYNGFCQIWVDEDFDFELAASHLPREFGGLKVTYFTHGPSETSSRSHVQTTVVEGGSHEPNAGRAAAHREISITPTIGCGSEIDVISAILSKSVGRALRSRIGVKILTESDSVEVITMSSHAAFAPRIYKTLARKHLKLGFLSRGWNRLSGRVENEPVQTLDQPQVTADTTERWWESVEIFAAGSDKKIGNIHKTYDENASEDTSYPIGFQHDISLVKPDTDSMRMLSGMKCPAREWYRDAAIDTRSRLYVLGSHQIDGQGLPKYWAEPVGKGIMVNQNTFPTEKRWKEGDIKQLIGRCTLWRPLNASSGWNGWSGAPVIVNKEDGTEELLGFQSFVQDSHHRQFAMPDRRLKMDCANGYISFGACMKLPQEILSSTIL